MTCPNTMRTVRYWPDSALAERQQYSDLFALQTVRTHALSASMTSQDAQGNVGHNVEKKNAYLVDRHACVVNAIEALI